MTSLSVNINKIATLRNARGGNHPEITHAAKIVENSGADLIIGGHSHTVQPYEIYKGKYILIICKQGRVRKNI